MNSSQLRAKAREYMKGRWGNFLLAIAIVGIITGALAAIPYIGSIGSLVVSGPLTIGLVTYILNGIRHNELQIETIFKPFQENFVNSFLLMLLKGLYIFLWSLLFVIPGIIKSFSYALAEYLMVDDPSLDATAAITKSREMMDGHKMRYFLLQLSFIGWMILSVFTLGILLIYVIPYMELAKAAFYLDLIGDQQVEVIEHVEEIEEVEVV